jgi:hypothetical protein
MTYLCLKKLFVMDTKKILILITAAMLSLPSFCQKVVKSVATKPSPVKAFQTSQRADSLMTRVDSLIQLTNMWLEQIELDNSLKNRYKLYQTDNIYTLLQLDTKTGQIEQVQWSLESNNEGSVTINGDDLTFGYGHGSNSFELNPTKNMYQFILLDKTNGKKWHVQWGMKASERWIRRIY